MEIILISIYYINSRLPLFRDLYLRSECLMILKIFGCSEARVDFEGKNLKFFNFEVVNLKI